MVNGDGDGGMLKLQIDWQEHFLSHWKALEKITIMFLTCFDCDCNFIKSKRSRERW